MVWAAAWKAVDHVKFMDQKVVTGNTTGDTHAVWEGTGSKGLDKTRKVPQRRYRLNPPKSRLARPSLIYAF